MLNFAVVLLGYLPHILPFLGNSGQTKNGIRSIPDAMNRARAKRLLIKLTYMRARSCWLACQRWPKLSGGRNCCHGVSTFRPYKIGVNDYKETRKLSSAIADAEGMYREFT
jgi:hypothetical protein